MSARQILIQADARRLPLADCGVHCCITSPPYWSLRDYGVAPSVWSGRAACEHEWTDPITNNATNHTDKRRWQHTRNGRDELQPTEKRVAWLRTPVNQGSICQKCGAWFGCLGLEPTAELYIAHVVQIFREVRRVLRDDGTLWLNIGDSYNGTGRGGGTAAIAGTLSYRDKSQGGLRAVGSKSKDLIGIPWMLAFALRADGWYLRQDIIWAKPNPMPESVTDRCTKSHEYLFLLTKSARYFYDADAIREPVTSTGGASFGKQNHDATGTMAQSRALASPAERNHPLGRNKRSVWFISTQSFPEAHFATYPVKLVTPCILAGTSEKGCCSACGAPWKRVVERIGVDGRGGRRKVVDIRSRIGSTSAFVTGDWTTTVTVAWLPTCKCAAGDPVPCTVLDPFNGAATTGVAAKTLGRSYIGVELKAEYIDISRKRLDSVVIGGAPPRRKRLAIARTSEGSLFGNIVNAA
jgi:DNA modification methylase